MSAMRILVATTVFAPSIGGIETVAALLVRGLISAGHSVTLLTCTPGGNVATNPNEIVRNPSIVRTLISIWQSDAVILQGLTLKLGWPLLIIRKPAIVAHHFFQNRDNSVFSAWLRDRLARSVIHVACSSALASRMKCNCTVIGNPYDNVIFTHALATTRSKELIFIGRLVREKGLDILLAALAILKGKGFTPKLTVVGEGPLRDELEQTAGSWGLSSQVQFRGPRIGKELAALLNEHKVLVVPSSCDEPFGIVALEGIACGCVVVGSSGGGLPEAIGSGGVSFPNCDTAKLASAIEATLNNHTVTKNHREIEEHLARHSPARVTERYLEQFKPI